MADDPTESTSDKKPNKRKRRGAFPRVPLKSVIELVDAIYELGHGDPVRRRTAFEHIGRSPDSSASYTLIAAANSGYNAIKGGKTATDLELRQNGLRIAKSRGAEERKAAVVQTLFENEFFSALIDKFSDRPLPLDSIAADYLEREHDLERSDAESCWSVAKENLLDFGLIEDSAGKQVIPPREQMLVKDATIEASDDTEEDDKAQESLLDELKRVDTPVKRRRVSEPQIVFNIQVVLPENADASTYDSIFESIAKHLLARDER